MKGAYFKLLCLGLITVMLFSTGCASGKRVKKIQDLKGQVMQLTQTLQEKEAELATLQASLDDMQSSYEGSLAALESELEKYKAAQAAAAEAKEMK